MEAHELPVLDQHSQGIFCFSNWMKEGDGLLIAAKALRQQWLLNKEEVRQIVTAQAPRSPEVFLKDNALARSSMLLLGYAAEMFLKAGLIKLYKYCPEVLVGRELRRYGHDYESLAKRLHAPITEYQYAQLNGLSKSVVDEARYPVTPTINENFFDKVNAITFRNHGQANFESLLELLVVIRDFVARVDSDSANPASFSPLPMRGGYFVARHGGHLMPSIVYRCDEPITLPELRVVIENVVSLPGGWEQYELYEDIGDERNRKCARRR